LANDGNNFTLSAFNNQLLNQPYTHRHSLLFCLITAGFRKKMLRNAVTTRNTSGKSLCTNYDAIAEFMHGHFRHTIAVIDRLSAQGHDLINDWSLPSAHFVDS